MRGYVEQEDASTGQVQTRVRTFETGATRSSDVGKPSYVGFMSPLVVERFGEYMLKHQIQADGTLREPDNWKNGIPLNSYLDSILRHFVALWLIHEGHEDWEDAEDVLCALKFNVDGYLHEVVQNRREEEAT